MALDTMLARLEQGATVTAVTAEETAAVTANPAPALAVTAVTAVTAEKDKGQGVAAEPARRPPTEAERAELLALLAAIYATDTDQDRQEAMDCAMADPDGALLCYRAIAAERGLVVSLPAPAPAPAPPACRRCRHRATPGRADPGYCAIRTDQPRAYGTDHPLRRLPDDGGTICPMFEARQHERGQARMIAEREALGLPTDGIVNDGRTIHRMQ